VIFIERLEGKKYSHSFMPITFNYGFLETIVPLQSILLSCFSFFTASALSDFLGLPSKIKLGFTLTEQPADDTDVKRPRTNSQRRSEIINDSAIKTVLKGLDATITLIEENSNN
jgi:hypothetical protein